LSSWRWRGDATPRRALERTTHLLESSVGSPAGARRGRRLDVETADEAGQDAAFRPRADQGNRHDQLAVESANRAAVDRLQRHVGRTVEPCRVRLGLEGEPSDPARPIEAQVLDPRQPAVTEEPSGDRVEVADVVVAQAAGGPGRPSLPLSTISSNRRSGNPSWAWKAGSRSSAMTALTDPRKRCSALEPQADFLASLKPFEGG
jgi:hypothetical protein